MRLGRAIGFGGSIILIAALAHFHFEGLTSAAGLFIAVFAALVVVGLVLAGVAQRHGSGATFSVTRSLRRARNRRSLQDACSVCARIIINTGRVRVCASCDRIPVMPVP